MNDRGLGICVIGRNEAARLGAALSAIADRGEHRVYVDSASTDDSVAIAHSFHGRIDVLQCPGMPRCTAALGRNAGFARLRERVPGLEFVQFIDGDCVMKPGWLERGVATLRARPDVGIVAGRLSEEDRDRNIYHRLADMEWASAVGEVDSVGGICMVRADIFHELGGMDPAMAQGEEAELARRMKARGYRTLRVAADMARHDIAMESFEQWWARAAREGKATAETVHRNGRTDRESMRHLTSMLWWGGGVPGVAAALLLPTLGASTGLLGAYSVLWRRIRKHREELGDAPHDAALYATATVLGKIANMSGVARYGSRVMREWLAAALAQRGPAA